MGIKWAKNSSLDWKKKKKKRTQTSFLILSLFLWFYSNQMDSVTRTPPPKRKKKKKKPTTLTWILPFPRWEPVTELGGEAFLCSNVGLHWAPGRQQPVLTGTPSWTKQRARHRMKCRGLALTTFPLFKELGFVYMTHIGQTKETKSSSFPEVRKIQLL